MLESGNDCWGKGDRQSTAWYQIHSGQLVRAHETINNPWMGGGVSRGGKEENGYPGCPVQKEGEGERDRR